MTPPPTNKDLLSTPQLRRAQRASAFLKKAAVIRETIFDIPEPCTKTRTDGAPIQVRPGVILVFKEYGLASVLFKQVMDFAWKNESPCFSDGSVALLSVTGKKGLVDFGLYLSEDALGLLQKYSLEPAQQPHIQLASRTSPGGGHMR